MVALADVVAAWVLEEGPSPETTLPDLWVVEEERRWHRWYTELPSRGIYELGEWDELTLSERVALIRYARYSLYQDSRCLLPVRVPIPET